MNDRELLGMTLDTATKLLEAHGKDMSIEWTCSPRGAHEIGEPRVVRARDGVLTVARFPFGVTPPQP